VIQQDVKLDEDMEDMLYEFFVSCEHRSLRISLVQQNSSLMDQVHVEMGVP